MCHWPEENEEAPDWSGSDNRSRSPRRSLLDFGGEGPEYWPGSWTDAIRRRRPRSSESTSLPLSLEWSPIRSSPRSCASVSPTQVVAASGVGISAASPRRSPSRSCSPTQVVNDEEDVGGQRRAGENAVDLPENPQASLCENELDDFHGVDPLLADYARPLLVRLRGPAENWPTAKDFCDVPLTECRDDARCLNQCFAQIDHLRESKDDLEAAGARPLPPRMNALPVEVALFCLSRATGFPDKLVKQVFETMKAASLRKDLELHIKSSLKILPRVPSLGIAAPGSKKTPVQQELINRVFCKVLERFPFLAHNSETQGEHLLFDGGSTAGFVKQLKQNQGYIYLVVEELVSFFDPGYAASGNTNTGQHIAPSTLLPLRTGNGISRSLASDLGNRIEKTQAAMSMMGQEDVVRKFFCAKGM